MKGSGLPFNGGHRLGSLKILVFHATDAALSGDLSR